MFDVNLYNYNLNASKLYRYIFYHPYAGDILLWGITIFYWELYIKKGN